MAMVRNKWWSSYDSGVSGLIDKMLIRMIHHMTFEVSKQVPWHQPLGQCHWENLGSFHHHLVVWSMRLKIELLLMMFGQHNMTPNLIILIAMWVSCGRKLRFASGNHLVINPPPVFFPDTAEFMAKNGSSPYKMASIIPILFIQATKVVSFQGPAPGSNEPTTNRQPSDKPYIRNNISKTHHTQRTHTKHTQIQQSLSLSIYIYEA